MQAIEGDELAKVMIVILPHLLFINNLYNEVPEMLTRQGIPVPYRLFDNRMATDLVVQYIGAQNILDILLQNHRLESINDIIRLIDQEIFHIKIYLGQHQRNEDLKLLAELHANNPTKKATAILKVLYYVRCNIFHGHKNFEEYQRMLVVPLFRILEVLNIELYNRLQS